MGSTPQTPRVSPKRLPCVLGTTAIGLAVLAATVTAAPQTSVSGQPAASVEATRPLEEARQPSPDGTVAAEERVEVIAPTPIAGLGVDRDKVPANIQRLSDERLRRTGATAFIDQLQAVAPSVHVNEATTNPFQPDLQFRGFVGSPLLGLPQGLAVYQDGVRLNEPFGDSVNWDLLPAAAVADVEMMPGSNPLFGLNALGGAVALRTKTGASHPGHSAMLTTGSFGRHLLQAASGGQHAAWNWFVAGTAGFDQGWRDESPSRVRQLFADLGWQRADRSAHLTVTLGNNRLIGNGAAPIELLEEDRSAIFTYPDETKTRAALVTLRGQQRVGAALSLDAVLAYRRAGIDSFNGDDSDYDECAAIGFEAYLCNDEGDGEPVRTPDGAFIDVDDDLELNGTNNTSATTTHGWSAGLQATLVTPLAGRANHLVAGVSLDGGHARYEADTEIARLTDARGTVGIGVFDADALVRLRTRVRHAGAYVADFFSLTPRLTLSGAARLTHSLVVLRDQAGDDLDGDHAFVRVNPGAGATFALTPDATVFGGISQSSRVPAPSELSCADPEAPCRLPNAFVADPPLEQVVATTWEAGVRGRHQSVQWSAALFRTANRDDIMFISSGPLRNTGHFENIGRTVRHGAEVAASGTLPAVHWGVSYTLLRARFAAPLIVSSPNHPGAVDGEIRVDEGDRLPGIPQHQVKAQLTGRIARLTIGAQASHLSRQYLRGDEANLLPALDGATLVHLHAGYDLHPRVRVIARVTNVFDARYATFGLLGEADEVLGDDYEDPRFLSPGAPRAAAVGLSLSF